jgi:peptidoglycan hydrolase-like protein with peptidoglycan-binding domain
MIVLRKGARGTNVKELQRLLTEKGYDCGAIDGIFGNKTFNAVLKFQADKALVIDGIVGKNTWAALYTEDSVKRPTLKRGSKGIEVQELQKLLNDLNYKCGAVDGIFGKATKAAVVEFQKTNGLAADGIVGPKTWDKLFNKPVKAKLEVVYYSQKDSRWGGKMYSSTGNKSQTIASSGCGPVSMAMIISTLIKPVLPPVLCTLAVKNGWRTANSGTAWGFFFDAAREYGLRCSQKSNTDDVVAALKDGKLAIANMGPGYWTDGGHYIVLTGADDKDIFAHDPASVLRTKATIASFKNEAKTYFIFTKE